ncbi:MAG: DUF6147 family protein [Faecalicatena sp.]|uniref:DUF6147 family protein n=1 Tax=Faecalicatena sp. TaxID=2005360 RepID=UPI0025872C35|nr:DUF6147 family protein [Faecalicatena sp.]MCI6467398.1 DUF6147 family protein [Faecalicatena sp.]MDY5621006.1 DUF6147 family protein [Lachnospiraceae bacterium]
MKKKILSLSCVVAIFCSMFMISYIDARASENEPNQVDGSYLTTEEYSKGTTALEHNVRGTYLMDGECSITKAGRGKIYVYASTTANHDVDYVGTIIYVDRYNQETKSWGQIDYWRADDYNTYYVATSKMLSVDKGYFYRVHADHFAGMDADYPYEEATSLTDGIWID